ncbi:hypothetical protein [Mucilaginibacter sp. L196]|nr:hypothetical protein [Mucilaginibacter sp. L196]
MLRNEASIRLSASAEPIDRFFTAFRMTKETSPNHLVMLRNEVSIR